METNPHKVPQDFFENQRREILASVLKSDTSMAKKPARIYSLLRPTLAVAASLAGIFFLTLFINEITPKECKTFACLLESTDLSDLSETEEATLEEWEYELYEDIDIEQLENLIQ